MKVYFISGIAADQRAFKHIRLPEGFEADHLTWIKPDKKESLHDYAVRLSRQIDTHSPFCLVGLSMGGIMASEIANLCKPKATIIIGSVPVVSQLPPYYAWVRKLKIHKLIPGSLYQFAAVTKHFFSSESAEDKQVIYRMVWETDPAFIRWGINAVLNWSNERKPDSLIHIHGTRDEVFPFAYVRPTHTINKGDHMLVITRPDEINYIIGDSLAPLAALPPDA
jgi:pimeloyl-ACP methyl ester carboxylesterase